MHVKYETSIRNKYKYILLWKYQIVSCTPGGGGGTKGLKCHHASKIQNIY